ncbi:MAG TPA: transporter substrate-binding domain-containing protein [Ignavibacteria bacterium]|nr:transporter substrate-binding domain-containing protein [Ignavibacteria bacterium]
MKIIILIIGLFCSTSNVIFAQTVKLQDKIIKIGVYESKPFSYKDVTGEWTGIAIDLWKLMASKNGIKYEITEIKQDEITGFLDSGKIDVVVSNIGLDSLNFSRIDLTYPYYSSEIGFAVKDVSNVKVFESILDIIFSWQFVQLMFVFVLSFLPVGILIWLFEKKVDKKDYGNGILKGIGNGLFWAGTTFTTIAGEKNPTTFAGRLVTIIWMFISVVAVSFFTAGVTNIITQDVLNSRILNKKDLAKKEVGILNEFRDGEIESMGAKVKFYGNYEEGLDALNNQEIYAFIASDYVLRFYIKMNDYSDVLMYPMREEIVQFSFGLKKGSEYTGEVNRLLLNHIQLGEFEAIKNKYLDSK